ncbi:hypothetical protein N692_03360 [Lactiplantibacillus plantarum EGD-AQ4]|nr:hypothetical protein N692_03360 [Lactiplantibacillus plantarum EGD-AQ4]
MNNPSSPVNRKNEQQKNFSSPPTQKVYHDAISLFQRTDQA